MKQKNTKKERPQSKQEIAEVKQRLQQAAAVTEKQRRERIFNFLSVAFIFVVGIIIYSNSFDCSFNFDDKIVFQSPLTQSSSTIWDWINLFPSRPFGTLTFAFNYYIHGLDLWGYHLVNLIIHLTNAFLVWWLTWLTLSTPAMKDSTINKYKMQMAFLTGLLFVSHPLATQSVTYIVQRYASLATLFYLLSLALFVQGKLWQGDKNISWFLFGGSIVCAVLGMLTKEIVFTLPFAILLYDYCFLKTAPWKLKINDKGLIFSFIMLGIFLLLFLRSFSLNSIFDTVPPIQGYTYSISAKEYLFTQFSVIITYIRLFILPINQNLDYDYPVSYSLFEPATFFSFLLLLFIFGSAVLLFRKYRLISFGIFWFFLTLSVESSVIPISQNVIFEHRTYLPSFGFFLVLTSAAFYFVKERYLKIAMLIIMLIASFNAILTYQRNKVWKSETTLWTDCVNKSPNKARPYTSLGVALAKDGKNREAISHYLAAIEINPFYDNAHGNLGVALAAEGKNREAVGQYREAIKINPLNDYAHCNLGVALAAQRKNEEAIAHYLEAVKINPVNADAYYNLANLLVKQGKMDEAANHYRQAIKINPDHEGAHYNFAEVLVKQGRIEEAIEHFRETARIKPSSFKALNNLGVHLEKQLRHDEAINYYRLALPLEPQNPGLHFNLGVALGNKGELKEAIEHFRRAIELKSDFEDARRALKLALSLEQEKKR